MRYIETPRYKFMIVVKLKQGIPTDAAKDLVKRIKNSKLKVQAQIQSDQVRVTGKKRDDLQAVISFVKEAELELPLDFVNFRDWSWGFEFDFYDLGYE